MSTALVAKVLGGLLCLIFLITLKPLLAACSRRMPAVMHHYFLEELGQLKPGSNLPGALVAWPLVIGLLVAVVVGIAVDAISAEGALVVGAAVGTATLYVLIYVTLGNRAKKRFFEELTSSTSPFVTDEHGAARTHLEQGA